MFRKKLAAKDAMEMAFKQYEKEVAEKNTATGGAPGTAPTAATLPATTP